MIFRRNFEHFFEQDTPAVKFFRVEILDGFWGDFRVFFRDFFAIFENFRDFCDFLMSVSVNGLLTPGDGSGGDIIVHC